MKVSKALPIITLISVFLAVTAPLSTAGSLSAFAADTPHIAVSGEVWLLSSEGSRLFMLPDTYYARINNLDDSFYYVTFNGVSGKVDKNTVSTVGYHTAAAGTMRDINISAEYAEFTAINLKSSPDLSAENTAQVPVSAAITFLGVYPTDTAVWYYVKYEQFYGYLRADRTSMPTPEIRPFVPEQAPADAPTSAPEDDGDDGKTVLDALDDKELKIIIIVGLAVPALAVVILLFRSKGGKRSRERYED